MEYANRSQKFSAEFDDQGTMTFMIDGKVVTKLPPWQKATRKSITGQLWEVVPSKEDDWAPLNSLDPFSPFKRTKPMGIIKNGNKEFSRKFGMNPKQVFPVINAIQYKMAILPYKDYFKLFKTNNSINPTKYRDVINSFELLEQARKDGIMNITPFIASENKSPQELKKKFGKGLWKKICGNSLHRNISMCSAYYRDAFTRFDNHIVEHIENISTFDTSAIANRYTSAETAQWIKANKLANYVDMKRSGRNSDKFLEWNNIVSDTKRMASQLGLNFSLKWSPRKMKEKHDEYSEMYGEQQEVLRRERNEKYRKEMEEIEKIDLSDVYPVLEWNHDGVSGRVLTTYKEIVAEGRIQGHCVGSYAVNAVEMNYAVIHLESESEKTTLGLNVSRVIKADELECVFFLNQHYGAYNQPVKNRKHRELQEIIIKSLNSAKIKVKQEKVNIQAKLV